MVEVKPLVSICCPVLNEREFLPELVKSVLCDEPDIHKELLLIDGGSIDGSRDWIEEQAKIDGRIILIKNTDRYVSQGFNKAYKEASGAYLALIGAHAIYPEGYFSRAVQVIGKKNADAAGGILKQVGKTKTGNAIALAMSSVMGVGNTGFRTGSVEGPAESVPFAVYRRSVFDKIGLFDEAFVRNQDDEFHYRMNQYGLIIYLDPSLEVIYFVRDTYRSLWKQYFQYGLYKPMVLYKVKSGLRPRHLIPALFVLYLLTLPLAIKFLFWSIPFCFYLLLTGIFSFRLADFFSAFRVFFAIFILHLAYGIGFLFGLMKIKRATVEKEI